MNENLREIDIANYLNDAEDMRLYLKEVLAERDADAIRRALGDVARAAQVAVADHRAGRDSTTS